MSKLVSSKVSDLKLMRKDTGQQTVGIVLASISQLGLGVSTAFVTSSPQFEGQMVRQNSWWQHSFVMTKFLNQLPNIIPVF